MDRCEENDGSSAVTDVEDDRSRVAWSGTFLWRVWMMVISPFFGL
jgi:hypothetical protein